MLPVKVSIRNSWRGNRRGNRKWHHLLIGKVTLLHSSAYQNVCHVCSVFLKACGGSSVDYLPPPPADETTDQPQQFPGQWWVTALTHRLIWRQVCKDRGRPAEPQERSADSAECERTNVWASVNATYVFPSRPETQEMKDSGWIQNHLLHASHDHSVQYGQHTVLLPYVSGSKQERSFTLCFIQRQITSIQVRRLRFSTQLVWRQLQRVLTFQHNRRGSHQ